MCSLVSLYSAGPANQVNVIADPPMDMDVEETVTEPEAAPATVSTETAVSATDELDMDVEETTKEPIETTEPETAVPPVTETTEATVPAVLEATVPAVLAVVPATTLPVTLSATSETALKAAVLVTSETAVAKSPPKPVGAPPKSASPLDAQLQAEDLHDSGTSCDEASDTESDTEPKGNSHCAIYVIQH
jgi:hypothetical protein